MAPGSPEVLQETAPPEGAVGPHRPSIYIEQSPTCPPAERETECRPRSWGHGLLGGLMASPRVTDAPRVPCEAEEMRRPSVRRGSVHVCT